MRERKIDPSTKVFALVASLSFTSGLLIFLFVHGGFIRNYGGDVVAVTFLYSVLRLTLRSKPKIAAAVVLATALLIELFQAMVSLPHSTVSTIAIGQTFDPLDILTYSLTVLALYMLDKGLKGLRTFSSASGS